MAIVKEIAERHGGRVWIDSLRKPGATICFSIVKNLTPSDEADNFEKPK